MGQIIQLNTKQGPREVILESIEYVNIKIEGAVYTVERPHVIEVFASHAAGLRKNPVEEQTKRRMESANETARLSNERFGRNH